MVLRVMQIIVPQEINNKLEELLEGRELLGRWRDTDADTLVLQLLVPAEESEPIMDRFEQEYANTHGFHVIIFPVEAVLPRPKSKAEETQLAQPVKLEGEIPGKQRISREELYAQANEGLEVSRVFLGMTILSAVVAAVGLMRNDVAVIIGAMVIAPLLGPNIAMSLATTLGDLDLLRRALVTNLAGLMAAFGLAVCCGLLFTVNPAIPAIASRTQLGWENMLLALAAGSAGTLAFTQGLPGAVIGVMVAVALMPPLVVSGMLLGEGHFASATGAFLLTIANVICINLAGVATFLLQGVQPRNWWEADRAKKATWQAIVGWFVLLAVLGLILWLTS